MTIRPAIPSDAAVLSLLISQNAERMLKPHYNEAQWEVFIRYYSPAEMLEKFKTQTIFCGIKEDHIVGTVALEGNFVLGFYTRLDHLGQGIGKQMMTHLENHARSIGLTDLELASSPEGLAFYYKHDWQKVRDIIAVHYGVGYEETLMRKDL